MCEDGLTLAEYCEFCSAPETSSTKPSETCSMAGPACSGASLPEPLTGKHRAGCGYIVLDTGTYGTGRRMAFHATTGQLTGVSVTGDTSTVGICDGYSAGAGYFPPFECQCPCEGEQCRDVAKLTSCPVTDSEAGTTADGAE